MALTSVTLAASGGAIPSAPVYVDRITAVGPASYSSGGEAFDPATAAILGTDRTILSVLARGTVTSTGKPSTHFWEWDRAGALLVVSDQNRVETTDNLSTETVIVTVISQ